MQQCILKTRPKTSNMGHDKIKQKYFPKKKDGYFKAKETKIIDFYDYYMPLKSIFILHGQTKLHN